MKKTDIVFPENDPRYNSLASGLVFDNSCGNASTLQNKSSLWVVQDTPKPGRVFLRLCNIATTNIDGLDNVGLVTKPYKVKGQLYSAMLPEMLSEAVPEETNLYMNSLILWQLSLSNLIQVIGKIYYFMDVKCNIDNRIKNDEKTVA